jgi:hypothetical protein
MNMIIIEKIMIGENDNTIDNDKNEYDNDINANDR